MPTASRWLIKTSLLYLALGLGIGLIRAGQSAGWLPGAPNALWLPQLHALTVGWLTQLIFGVAYWLFPTPRRTASGRRTRLVWAAYGALNIGLLLRVVVEPGWMSEVVRANGLLASAALQWIAVLLFVGAFWHRVRTK